MSRTMEIGGKSMTDFVSIPDSFSLEEDNEENSGVDPLKGIVTSSIML